MLGLADYDSPGAEANATPEPASSLLSIVDYDVHESDPQRASMPLDSLDDDELDKEGAPRALSSVVQHSVVRSGAASSKEASSGTWEMPGSPKGEVGAEVMKKFQGFVRSSQEGSFINDHIRTAKRFRNPDLLEKLVSFMGVQEFGTNYPPRLYDSTAVEPAEFYDKLEEARKRWEKRQARKEGEAPEFVPSSAAPPKRPPPEAAAAPPAEAAAAKRKSKWGDAGGSSAGEPDAQRPRAA
jgi:hypothetical protein